MNILRLTALLFCVQIVIALPLCSMHKRAREASQEDHYAPTRLMQEVLRNGVSKVEKIVKRASPLELDAQGSWGDTAVMIAVAHRRIKILKILLDAGASVDKTEEQGLTPLMVAAMAGYVEEVGLLLSCGANVYAVSSKGMTALELAQREQAAECREVYAQIIARLSSVSLIIDGLL